MSRFKKWIPFIGIVLFLFLLLGGCGRKGELKPNQPPTITITSYGGADTLSNNLESFQQKVFWEAHDVDGIVKYYAYRVLDMNGNPIATPGHQYIDNDGWVYHYKVGIDVQEDTPTPDTPGYGTIWTKDVYALINFPAHNAAGDSADVASKFEVKCIDNMGEESNIASKIFNVNSRVPEVIFEKKEDLDGKTVGQGLYIEFKIGDPDLGMVEKNVPDHFEFMLKKRSNITGQYIETEGYNQWYSVYKHNESFGFTISKNTTPALSPNTYNQIYDTFMDSTIMVYKAYDLAGIASQPDSVVFAVKTGFHPGSLIYEDKCYALGKYQYSLINETDQIVPTFQNSSGTIFYAVPPATNLNGEKAVIGSDDIKFYMNWGWLGEYNSEDAKVNAVIDEETNIDYYSKISAFWVRLDNEPLYLPYLPATGANLKEDEDGKEWLCIPASHYNFQSVILTKTNLEHASGNLYGMHKFEVKAIDIQGVADPTPAEYIFKIDRYLTPEERTGILVLDNELDNGALGELNQRFLDMLDDNINMTNIIYTTQDPNYKDKISITDYLKYKFIILHSEKIDQSTEQTKLKRVFNTLQMYLDFGGNLMLSGGANLRDDISYLNGIGLGSIFSKYFGIDMPSLGSDADYAVDVYTDITGTPSGYRNLQFFIGATSDADYPALSFDYENSQSFDPLAHSEAINPEHALGPVSFIKTPNSTSTPIYYFKSIDAGDGPKQPTESLYQELSNYVVGQKKVTDANKCYIFTFPISYMEIDEGKALFNKIISEVMGQ